MYTTRVKRSELRRQGRDSELGEGFRSPPAVAMDRPHRTHVTIKRQFAGALVKDLAVDIRGLLGGEKDAERSDRIGAAAPQPFLAQRRCLRVLWGWH